MTPPTWWVVLVVLACSPLAVVSCWLVCSFAMWRWEHFLLGTLEGKHFLRERLDLK